MMKNLFVSFVCCNDNDQIAHGNIVIPKCDKLENKEDIRALQEYIEMTHGLQGVIIVNYRRME